MKKILFIVNNLSGTVRNYNIPKVVEMYLDTDQYDYDFYFINQESKKREYRRKFDEDFDIYVAVGGDGTLLEMGQYLIEKKKILGIIPVGSGNGLATHLGYKPRDIEAAFDIIHKHKVVAIDVAKINDSYFFSNMGIGFDAVIAKKFKVKKNRGLLQYAYLGFKNLLKLKAQKIDYQLEGSSETQTVNSYLFNVFNSNLFGYNVGLVPWASAQDGLLNLVYIPKTSWVFLPYIFFCILIKKPQWTSKIVIEDIKKIKILHTEKKTQYQVDGDPQKSKKDLEIEVLPNVLKVLIP